MQSLRIVSAVFALQLLVYAVAAVGVSPAGIDANNVLRGGYAEATFRVFNTEDFPQILEIAAIGPESAWVTFDPASQVNAKGRESIQVKAMIRPPEDTPNGVYHVFIRVSTRPVPDESGGVGAQISTGVEATLTIRVSDEQQLNVAIESVVAKDVEESSKGTIFVTIANRGNVKVTPSFAVSIKDRNGQVVKSFDATGEAVLPTVKTDVLVTVPAESLLIGTYTAVVKTSVNGVQVDEREAPFSVVEIGGLRKFGEFVSLTAAPTEASAGDIVKVTAAFKNSGGVGLDAKFVGEVYLDQSLAATLTSEELVVAMGESKELSVFFKPEKPGSYSVRGRVIYSKRTTEDKEAIVKVSAKQEDFPWAYAVAAVVILGALAYIFTRKGGLPPVVVSQPRTPSRSAPSAKRKR